MVWKSDRWQARVEALDAPPGSAGSDRPAARPAARPAPRAAAPEPGPGEPGTLEIAYCRGDGGCDEREFVFEDTEDQQPPRLLVSLGSVTALKELCEHEHARYDKVVATLTECRSAYYKELRWLREQLHLAHQTDEEAMVRKANLTPDDFEVYWFEPENYLDPQTKEFLLKCIRETNRKLIDENRALQTKLQERSLLDSDMVPTVIRQLRKHHSVSKILREFRGQLKANPEIAEFDETCCDLVAGAALRPRDPPAPDPAAAEERDDLRRRLEQSEALVRQLRGQLSQGIDVQLARQRADAERQRADCVQQRAERLELQQRALRKEIRESSASIGERTIRVQRSLSKLSGALTCLSPSGSSTCTPSVSPKRQRAQSGERGADGAAEASFDEALGHLDEVATGFEFVAQEVLAELQDLRARLAELEAERAARAPPGATDDEGRAAAERRAEAAEAALAAARAKCAALEMQLSEATSRLEHERAQTGKLRQELAEAQASLERLGARAVRMKSRIDELKAEVRALRGMPADEGLESDEEDFDIADFMVPYRKRAAVAVGKPRWQLLCEDAECARKKRELLASQRVAAAGALPGVGVALAQPQEVSAAFQFLSAPGRALAQARPSAVQALRQLQARLQPCSAAGGRRLAAVGAPPALCAPPEAQAPSGAPAGASPAPPAPRAPAPAGGAGGPGAPLRAPSPAPPPAPPPGPAAAGAPAAAAAAAAPWPAGAGRRARASPPATARALAESASAPQLPDAKILRTPGRMPLKEALSGGPEPAPEAGLGAAARRPSPPPPGGIAARPCAAGTVHVVHDGRPRSTPVGARAHAEFDRPGRAAGLAAAAPGALSPELLLREAPAAHAADAAGDAAGGPRASPALRSAARVAFHSQALGGATKVPPWSPEKLPSGWAKQPPPEIPGAGDIARSSLPGRGGTWLGSHQRTSMPFTNVGAAGGLPTHGAAGAGRTSRSAAGRGLGADGFLAASAPALPPGWPLRGGHPSWHVPCQG